MRILLHICCGVCAAAAAERLIEDGHDVTGLFYNPNIYPLEEYQRRLEAARRVAQEMGFPLIEAPYDHREWASKTEGLEDETEGGRRCEVCFRIRLEESRRQMLELGFEAFTTTLTVGPRKAAQVINRIGGEVGGKAFMAADFKKKGGFNRAGELARRWNIYRQNYCGCPPSMNARKGLS